MIPYFELKQIPIAPGLSISVFGTLVTIGIFAGVWFSERRARVMGISRKEIHAAIACVLIPGFLLAHILTLTPLGGGQTDWSASTVLQFWNGMSSFGGFLGAFLGLAFFHARARRPWLAVADILLQALVIGWVFGRLGCTLVHDHIGQASDSLLAIRFADGGRHDLGLYELVFTLLVLVPAVMILNRRPRLPGTTVAVLVLLYAPARFLGDFLRHLDLAGADPRFFGLTLAQYGCLVLTGVGVAIAMRVGSGSASVRSARVIRVVDPTRC
jgi:phosphatidylglycerol:prolipoprotein diacylglycerol transferase